MNFLMEIVNPTIADFIPGEMYALDHECGMRFDNTTYKTIPRRAPMLFIGFDKSFDYDKTMRFLYRDTIVWCPIDGFMLSFIRHRDRPAARLWSTKKLLVPVKPYSSDAITMPCWGRDLME